MTTETLKLPTEAVNSDWRDDIDIDEMYMPYQEEKEYISPDKVDEQTIEKIKQIDLLHHKLGKIALANIKDAA